MTKNTSVKGTITDRTIRTNTDTIKQVDRGSVKTEKGQIVKGVDMAATDAERVVVGCDTKIFEKLKQDFRLARINHHHDVDSIKEFATHTNLPLEVSENILTGKVYVEIGVKENTIIYKPNYENS